MQNSKIIGLLKSLDAKEFRLLHKFLRSPFFNYSSSILDLYECIRRYYPEFDHPALDRQKVYQKLFPGQTYNDKKIRNLLHEFTNQLEEFMVQLQIRKDEYNRKKLLIDFYANRNQYEDFEKKWHALIKGVEGRTYRDLDTYLELITLLRMYYFHPLTDKLSKGDQILERMADNLDHHYKAGKLLIANEQLAIRELVSHQPLEDAIPGRLLEHLERGEEEPIVRLYYWIYQVNKTGSEEDFLKARDFFLDSFEQLSFDDQQLIIHQLINFASRLANRGKQEYYRIGFDLFRKSIEHKLLFYNGKITENAFTNIVVYGIKSGEMSWVEWFINEYQVYLDPENRENATLLGLSFLYYSQKRLAAVDELIGNHQFTSVFYQLRSRTILLRALYELFQQDNSYFELLSARIEAFEKYLRRNPVLSEGKKTAYLFFLRMLRKLVKWTMEKRVNPRLFDKLSAEIAGTKNLLHREWFMAQIKGEAP